MIIKQDILDRATEWQFRPGIVEKDYVLGWLLAALGAHAVAGTRWTFKGGTCIKKCYLETYRFSEDLDFSLVQDASYTEEELREILQSVARTAFEMSGIDFPLDRVKIRSRQDKQGRATFEGSIYYRGPLDTPEVARVLFDITKHEPVLDSAERRPIFHPYPDSLPDGPGVTAYSLSELLAEKTRALYERARPRDLYDVVYLLENRPDAFELPRVRDLFAGKCGAKGIETPSAARFLEVVRNDAELRSEWENMLAHQLPVLPKLDDLLSRLPDLLKWVDVPTVVMPVMGLARVPIAVGETMVAPPSIQYWGGGAPLETIRFAGANRLLIEFTYNGRRRRVEPYSLRRAQTGNLLFYGWEEGSTHIKAFNTAMMADVRPTNISFQPRYRIEFAAHGPLSAPASAQPIRSSFQFPRPRSSAVSRRNLHYGPTYVFEWDVFICHASEDKDDFVRPLAEELRREGLKVWYDESTLKVGDSLRQEIDRGLRGSRYGVVVLSPAFFAKGWPQKELDGLVAKEVGGKKVILPVWHKVTVADIREYSLPLADKIAARSSEGIPAVVEKLLEAIKG